MIDNANMIDLFVGSFAAQQRARLLEKVCRAGLYSWDLPSNVMRWSEGMYSLIGLPVTTAPTWALFNELVHPDDRISDSELEVRISTGLSFTRRLRLIWKNGRLRWLSSYNEFLLDEFGKIVKLVGVLTDVTIAYEQEQALKLAHNRFQSTISQIAPVIWVADPCGLVSQVSGWHDLTGRPDHSALGNNWIDGLHVDDRFRAIEIWHSALSTGRFYENQFRILQPTGEPLWVRSIAAPIVVDSLVQQWSGLVIDIGGVTQQNLNTMAPTGTQIRAARAMLKWSVASLSKSAGVTAAIIRRLEETESTAESGSQELHAIAKALTKAGVEFVSFPGLPPGVRPASNSQ